MTRSVLEIIPVRRLAVTFKESLLDLIIFFFPDQRIDDIKYWQKEVDDKLDGNKKETDSLKAFKARIDKAIEACREPLHIAQQCLANR